MEHCFTCGNKGFPDKICPECGREPTRSSLNLDRHPNVENFIRKTSWSMIPAKYQGIFWNREILEREYSAKLSKYNELGYDDKLFIKYLDQLEKINNIFVEKLLPQKSAFIIAPAGYSKMTFAYSCMQRALDAGFSVAPLLDTVELKRVLVLASENVHYKIDGRISYDDYIMADICFVTVTKLYTRTEAYQVIQELLDRRSRRGLCTFVLSRFSLNEIAKEDKRHSFEVVKRISDDSYKYPAIVSYAERG